MNVRRCGLGMAGMALLLGLLAGSTGCSMRIGGELSGEGTSREKSAAVGGSYLPLTVAPPPPYESHCSPAPSLVTSAICVCKTLTITGSLQTIGGSGGGADVGVGGDVELASGTTIDGSLRASGQISSAGSLDVRGHVWGARGVSFAGSLDVGGDLASGGDVEGAGSVDVGGVLRVDGSLDHAGSLDVGGRGGYTAPSAAPCGCDPASLYDVAKAVTIAKGTNDNGGAINLAGDGMVTVGTSELTLDSGRYYVKNLSSVGSLRIVTRGEVQLYVDGDLESVGSGNFTIESGSLDLFVAGSVRSVGSLDAGASGRPSAFRLYVGGKDAEISVTGSASFQGLLYAPTATVELTGGSDIHGAILAGSLIKTGSLTVHGERVTSYGERCEAPPQSVTTPPSSAPTPATPAPSSPSTPPPEACEDAGAPPVIEPR